MLNPRRLLILLAAAFVLLVAPATAAAAQTYSDTISGYEYAFTSTDGKFAGTASGALPGTWNADVQHTSAVYLIDQHGRERYLAMPVADHTKSGSAYLPADQLASWGHGIALLARNLLD